jgi:hypothetical protein
MRESNGVVRYSVTETAAELRKALKRTFPTVRFSVRSSSYAGGASIRIHWTDGPTAQEVDRIAQVFSGADFDGMQDLKTYHDSEWQGRQVSWGADFVFAERSYSRAFLSAVAAEVCAAEDVPDVLGTDDDAYIPLMLTRLGTLNAQEMIYRAARERAA